MGSIRENHAYSLPGVASTFMSLYMADEKEFNRHSEAWRWYFTLAELPDYSAGYIGGKRNNGGDHYLKKPFIMNACVGAILGAPKKRLYCYGGVPAVPGVSPGSLSKDMFALLLKIEKDKPSKLLTRLKNIAVTKKSQPAGESARYMAQYVLKKRVFPVWQEIVEANIKGDIYQANEKAKSFFLLCGKPDALKQEIGLLNAIITSPSGKMAIKHGKEYYTLVDYWTKFPKNRNTYKARFKALGEKGNDLYCRKARATLKNLMNKNAGSSGALNSMDT